MQTEMECCRQRWSDVDRDEKILRERKRERQRDRRQKNRKKQRRIDGDK